MAQIEGAEGWGGEWEKNDDEFKKNVETGELGTTDCLSFAC